MIQKSFITTSDGLKLFYTERGIVQLGQTVIFIHGWSSTGESSFGHLAESMSQDARCICFDLRGHGKSDSYGEISIDRMTDDLHDMIINLNLKKIILVGHSMGGLIIYAYFKKYKGEHVTGAAIFDMSPKVLCDFSWKLGLRTCDTAMCSVWERCAQGMVYSYMIQVNKVIKSIFHMMNDILPASYESILYMLWLDMLSADYREGARSISVPMIYFFTKRGMYPADVTSWLVENISGEIRCVDLYPYDHFSMTGATEEIVPELLSLI